MSIDTERLKQLADEVHHGGQAESTLKFIRAIEEASFPSEWTLPPERIPELFGHNSRVFRAVVSEDEYHARLGRAIGCTMIYPIRDKALEDFQSEGGKTTWYDMDPSIVLSEEQLLYTPARSIFIDVVVFLPALLDEELGQINSLRLMMEMFRHVADFIPNLRFDETEGELTCEDGGALPQCGCCTDDRGISEDLCKSQKFVERSRDRTNMGRYTLDLADYNKPSVSSERKEQIRMIARTLIKAQRQLQGED